MESSGLLLLLCSWSASFDSAELTASVSIETDLSLLENSPEFVGEFTFRMGWTSASLVIADNFGTASQISITALDVLALSFNFTFSFSATQYFNGI